MLFFDIETEANPDAIQFIDEPTAPANYKDADKIAAYIAEKKAELIEKAALDADYGRIVAIGLKQDDNPIGSWLTNGPEIGDEEDALIWFWDLLKTHNGRSCGYNIIGFDLPYIMRRSFDLGIKPSVIPDLRRYQTQPTLDLMMVLYGWQNFKSLKFVAQRYGIYNPLPELDGSQVKNMEPETLRAYVENDLYQKMQGIYF